MLVIIVVLSRVDSARIPEKTRLTKIQEVIKINYLISEL